MNLHDGRAVQFLVTCEHAYPTIPDNCQQLLRTFVAASETHRVYDPGALAVAEAMAGRLKAELLTSAYTRLAIDLNRSLGSPDMFAPPVARASELLKAELIRDCFVPFRTAAEQRARAAIESGARVIHLSVHSFTKIYEGQRRDVDVGILFDREREPEAALGKSWTKLLSSILPDYVCRYNQPYDGAADGHTTALRRLFSPSDYIGYEIELSQDLELDRDNENWAKLLLVALKKAIA